MGIGVSYTGSNGERKNFTAGSVNALEAAMSAVSPRRSMKGVDAATFAPPLPQQRETVEVKGGSAITKGSDGKLCLRGEEREVLVEGVRLYGSLNGRKGYFTFAEADPPIEGKLVGKWLNVDTIADGESVGTGEARTGWSVPLSRTACGVKDGKLRIVNYFRQLKFSKDGRAIGMTAESEMLVGEFETGGGDWCVLPEFANGTLSKLTFGTHALLKQYAEGAGISVPTATQSVETEQGCPYV